MKHFLYSTLLLFWTGCQWKPKLPNTPETVVLQYQSYYDKNQFDQAKELSTAAEQARLEDLRQIIESEPADSTVFTTTFLKINCQEQKDTAICNCEVQDIEEPYTTEYRLVRINGQWLVDAPEEEVEIEEEFMEPDSLEMDALIRKDTLKE
jgi:hypothetical protein